jgi:two-component system NtrC family sensor kinase
LSISYDIVKSHGGEMLIDSPENEGTMVRIILPLKDEGKGPS